MTKDDFENFWISSAFVYHDSRQREENQILPLGHFEWFRYKSPTSVRLSSEELMSLFRTFIPTFGTMITTGLLFTLDHVFWEILQLLVKFVKTAQESVKTGHVYLNIYSDQADGEIGIIASMFKEMADAFSQIEDTNVLTDQLADCLKEPQKPLLEFQAIAVAVSVLLLINIAISPWILRFRRYICVINRPLRERQRINWLRMSIKMTRGKGYLKRFKVYAQLTSKNGIIGMIARIVTGKTHYRCLQCLVAGGANSENFMPCLTPSCGAFYCFDCLPYLKNQCSRCRLKIIRQDMFSGNLSDVSSDEGETNNEGLFRYVT